MLRAEICLDREREHLAAAGDLYRRDAAIRIPRLLPLHSPRITAMARIDGRKITAASEPTPRAQRRLAQRLAEALLARPFFSDEQAAICHGDPHASNLFLDAEGRIVIIDWSAAVLS